MKENSGYIYLASEETPSRAYKALQRQRSSYIALFADPVKDIGIQVHESEEIAFLDS